MERLILFMHFPSAQVEPNLLRFVCKFDLKVLKKKFCDGFLICIMRTTATVSKLVIHPSTHFLYPLLLHSASAKAKVGLPVYQPQKDKQPLTLIHKFWVANLRRPKNQERTHADTGRTTQKGPRPRNWTPKLLVVSWQHEPLHHHVTIIYSQVQVSAFCSRYGASWKLQSNGCGV